MRSSGEGAPSRMRKGEGPLLDRRRTLGWGAAALVMWPVGTRVTAQDAIGEVAEIAGSAAVIRAQEILVLSQGDALFASDIVRTHADGRLLIRCRDGLRILVGSGTEVALRSYLADDGANRLRATIGLLRGIVRLIGAQRLRQPSIEVDTRTAVASVRSTDWLVESTPRGTGVLTLEGAVEVRGLAGGRVLVREGHGTDVPSGGQPTLPARWGETRRRDAIARTSL